MRSARLSDSVRAVCAYAARMHHAIGDGHHVASPLGAWLLLALVAPAAEGEDRTRLEAALGCPAAQAAALAVELLDTPHSALHLGAAAWRREGLDTPALARWLASLAGHAEVGLMPSQSQADAWADEHTLGLIREFPLQLRPDTLLVLASALACRIDWVVPFDVVDASTLRRPLTFDVTELLRDPGRAIRQAIVSSDVGLLGIHAAWSATRDLVVVSVIAEPGVAAADVLERAHPIAAALTDRRNDVRLTDLPLGPGPAWTITERPADGSTATEEYDTVLPAWSARSEHDLLADPSFGFATGCHALAGLIDDPDAEQIEAKQVALANYTRTGFEAAAVTGMAVLESAMRPTRRPIRTAHLEFGRPYAAVAVALGNETPWDGMPLFSAWITEADEPA